MAIWWQLCLGRHAWHVVMVCALLASCAASSLGSPSASAGEPGCAHSTEGRAQAELGYRLAGKISSRVKAADRSPGIGGSGHHLVPREKLFSPLPWLIVGLVLSLVLARPWLEWRMRQARKRREALKEKSERSARESHDVLLQELQGLVLRFEAVARRMPADNPLRIMMDTVLERADRVVLDGRDRVRAMQAVIEQNLELSSVLATFADDFVTDDSPTFCLVVEGTERKLEGRVHACVYAIGKEAIRNAFRHSRASHVEVEINHGLERFRLRVRDDGIGIDARIVGGAECPEHRGLAVMRERTLQVGAELSIWGRDGLGTEVELQVRSAIAYETGQKTLLSKLRRLIGGGRYK